MDHVDPALLTVMVPAAPALPAPEGRVVEVADVETLAEAITNAQPHTTILIADGTYELPDLLTLTCSDVTIRGASGNRDAVVLDGTVNHMDHDTALLRLKRASRVTIADVTFANSKKYGVLIYGDADVQDFTAYNVVFRNCWCRGLKGTDPLWPDDSRSNPRNSDETADRVRPHNGRVQYCLFHADHTKTDREDGFNGDYIAGIDMVRLSGWTFSDNVFANLRGANGGGRGAIFVWVGSDLITIERNLFAGCDRSIALGNPSYKGLSVTDAVIRHNRIVAGANRGIECNSTRNTEISGNVIFSTDDAYPSVEFIDGSEGGNLHHNLIHGRIACEPVVIVADNHIGSFAECFADPLRGNLQLTVQGKKLFPDCSYFS